MDQSERAAHGNPEVFDAEWRTALASGDQRWLSFPARHPLTQAELFERVKADQIGAILAAHGIAGGRALEYACGSAGMAIHFALEGFQTTALDLSLNALRLARRNADLRAAPPERFAAAAGDVFRLPFPDASFDLVMSYGLLEHFTPGELPALLGEITRILRPGGMHLVDIIHGRRSVRTAATVANFGASALARLARGRTEGLGALYRAYFDNYYENTLRPAEWRELFAASGLDGAEVLACRPFPLLAIGGAPERIYVALLKALLPAWRWFDRGGAPALAGLGWMYLAYGVKPRA